MKIGTLAEALHDISQEGRDDAQEKSIETQQTWIRDVLQPVLNRLTHRDRYEQIVEYRVYGFGHGVSIAIIKNGKTPNERLTTFEVPTDLWEHLYNLLIEKNTPSSGLDAVRELDGEFLSDRR